MEELLTLSERGLYCSAGDFYIDPTRPVERAVVTHAHADHARWGHRHYLTCEAGALPIKARLGEIHLETLNYGEQKRIGATKISFAPAGHILGSCQVRIEHKGRVAVVSGDYKTGADQTCDHFEPLKCDLFVSECTFGLPIYQWPDEQNVFDEINNWWRENTEAGKTSVVLAYSLGKAQRVLAGLDASIGPVAIHGSAKKLIPAYQAAGVQFPKLYGGDLESKQIIKGRGLIVAPPSVLNTSWLNKYKPLSVAFASGWMQTRASRRRRGVDKGFALSDHADWDGLLSAINDTEAAEVWLTHGQTSSLARYLTETSSKKIVELGFRREEAEEEDETLQ